MTAPNEPVRAFTEWMQGGKSTKAARVGAAEVVDECVRLRAMLRALSKVNPADGGGEAASVEVEVGRDENGLTIGVLVVCASQSERTIAHECRSAVTDAIVKALGMKGTGDDHFGWDERRSSETGTRAMEDGDG